MFSSLKKAFGVITVETKNGVVTVEGIPTYTIQNDIRKIWGTSRIEAYMFNHIGKSSFSFNAFFALDIVYAIQKILAQRYVRTSRRVLTNIIKEIRENTWLSTIDQAPLAKLNRHRLDGFFKTPMDKQSEFFDAYERITFQYNLSGMLLAAAAGSGKTITSLMLSEMLDSDITVVVSPLNAVEEVWDKTLRTEMRATPKYWISTNPTPIDPNCRYFIVHYEYLQNFNKSLHLFKGKKVNIVLDESHNFNTRDSLRTELFTYLCRTLQARDVLWMSGTPIKALGSEAIPLFRSIDPQFTADTEERFRKIFGISSTRGADILSSRLGIMSYKVEKKDLPIEDPEIIQMPVKMPNGMDYSLDNVSKKMTAFVEERKAYYATRKKEDDEYYYGILDAHAKTLRGKNAEIEYEQFRQDLKIVIAYNGDARFCAEQVKAVKKYEDTKIMPALQRADQVQFKDVRSIVKYVMLKIRGECLGRVVAKERMRAHYDLCAHVDYHPILDSSEKKTVIFTSFVEVLERLQGVLTNQHLNPVTVYGKTNAVLSATLKRFEEDDSVNPLIATYKSLSTAVPLLMADIMILVDAPFRDYVLQQTISRISRLGSTTRATVYMLSLDTGDIPNISSRSYDILKWSQSQVSAITGVVSPFDLNDELSAEGVSMEAFGEIVENCAVVKYTPAFLEW